MHLSLPNPHYQHEHSTKNAYLCLLLSRMVPSAVMEMLRAPRLGQWWEVTQVALKKRECRWWWGWGENGCSCDKCLSVSVCVCMCRSVWTRVPCRLCVKVGTETDWTGAIAFGHSECSPLTPLVPYTHQHNRLKQDTHTSDTKGNEEQPGSGGLSLTRVPSIFYFFFFVESSWNICPSFPEVKLWHVLLSCARDPWGPSAQWDLCEELLLAWCWEEVPAQRTVSALPPL